MNLRQNKQLELIFKVESKYGRDCWYRTDDEFEQDADVLSIRQSRRETLQHRVRGFIESGMTVDQILDQYGYMVNDITVIKIKQNMR